jgi:uncharacterized protein (TIGR03437 family)
MRYFPVFLLSAAVLYATPTMRLSTSTVGPLNIAVGQNGATQSVQVTNIGDGALSLSASANVNWITASIAGTNVQIALNTSSLPQGIATGIVTVTAANAVDGVQTISVTVQMGGGIPNSISLYMPPGGAASTNFVASSTLNPSVAAPSGGVTLSVLATGGSSFATTASYQVTATAPASTTPETSYNGSIKILSSGFAPDVKTVPVTVNVTALPIVTVSPASLQFNVGQGAAAVAKWIQLSNTGASALTVSGATVSTAASSGASWLTTSVSGSLVVATGDPTGLSPGKYTASVTIATNAKNGPFVVPVEMDVVATAPPLSYYQGIVDNALFQIGGTVAPGGLVAIKGEQFTTGAAVSATKLPLGTALGGATVYVNGVAAPIYYVAASHVVNQGGQLTFQMPYNAPSGTAIVRVDRNDNGTVQTGNSISVPVASQVPRLLQFPLNGTNYAIATFTDFVTFPVPVTPGVASKPATAGDVLIFYGLGFGQTVPAVTEGIGAPATPPYTNVPGALMIFGQSVLPGASVSAVPAYCGLTPGSVGLYQVNVTVPPGTPTGDAIPVSLALGSVSSNSVSIAVK